MTCISDILTDMNQNVDAIRKAVGGAKGEEADGTNMLNASGAEGAEGQSSKSPSTVGDLMLTKLDEMIEITRKTPDAHKEALVSANQALIDALKVQEEETREFLKQTFTELLATGNAPIPANGGGVKAIDALKTVSSAEDFDALQAEAKSVMENDCACHEDFQKLFDLLNEVLQKSGLKVDEMTGVMGPIDASAATDVGVVGDFAGTGDLGKNAEAAQNAIDDKKPTIEAWNTELAAFKDNAISAFDNMLQSGEFSIKALTKQLKQMAKNMLIQKLIPMMFGFSDLGAASGGGLGGLLGSFFGRETGGRVSAGTPYLVGEKRPEIFIPDHAGTVARSIGARGASNPSMNMVQNINFTPDVKNTVRAEIFQAAPQIAASARAMVFENLRGNRY